MKTKDMNGPAKLECVRLTRDRLSEIKTLWEELNRGHLRDSIHFKSHYETFTFEKRSQAFHSVSEDDLFIDVLQNDGAIVGYCVSTVKNGVGEIDSLFIAEPFRGSGCGKELVERAILWLENKKCAKIVVSVAYGHESVFPFYERLGFHPRMTVFELKQNIRD